MALLTEEDVRRMSDNGTRGPVVVNRGEVLTPGARDWLRAQGWRWLPPGGAAGNIRAKYRPCSARP